MAKAFVQRDTAVTGKYYVDMEGGGDTPAGGISYSTEEKQVGTGLEGEPLYQITVPLTELTCDGQWKTGLDVGITGVAKIYKYEAYGTAGTSTVTNSNNNVGYAVSDQFKCAFWLRISDGAIKADYLLTSNYGTTVELTVWYSKTTE